MQNVNKQCVYGRTAHTHIGVATSYQATVISPLISVQIKARSVAAELCWLIIGSCKGFWSLSMASGPHPHSRGSCDQGRGRPDRHGDEAHHYKHSASICSHDWLASALPDFSASLQRRHLWATRWCFVVRISKKHFHHFHSCFSTGFITNGGKEMMLILAWSLDVDDLKVCNRFDQSLFSLGEFCSRSQVVKQRRFGLVDPNPKHPHFKTWEWDSAINYLTCYPFTHSFGSGVTGSRVFQMDFLLF